MPKSKTKKSLKSVKSRKAAKVVKTTAQRNTPIPKATASAAPARKAITHEMVAKRAYEIFVGGTGGDEMHNWLRAERELRAL
jgi:Protein of unknown function (DUF2934)